MTQRNLLQGNVTFEVADVMTRDYPAALFDAIYSRDALLHIADKPQLLSRCGCPSGHALGPQLAGMPALRRI